MALSCVISETKQDIGRKSQFFHTPCIPRPRYGGLYCYNVWYRKIKMVWYGIAGFNVPLNFIGHFGDDVATRRKKD